MSGCLKLARKWLHRSSLSIAIEGTILHPGYFHGHLQKPWVCLRIDASQGLVINDLCLEQDSPEGSSISSIYGLENCLENWLVKKFMDPVISSIQDCRQEEALHSGAFF